MTKPGAKNSVPVPMWAARAQLHTPLHVSSQVHWKKAGSEVGHPGLELHLDTLAFQAAT